MEENINSEIPARPEDYLVPDVQLPESFKMLPENFRNANFDKSKFAAIMHEAGVTRQQANKIWEGYTKTMISEVENVHREMKTQEAQKQAELEKQQEEQRLNEMEESVSGADGYHLSKEEARALIDKITGDMNHPYWNEKAPLIERERARALVERLYQIEAGLETSVEGYLTNYYKEKEERQKAFTDGIVKSGSGDVEGRHMRYGERSPDNIQSTHHDIGFGNKETKTGYGQKIEDA